MTQAKIVQVDIVETENGLFRATSEDMVGLHVTAKSKELLKDRAKAMLRDLFLAIGEDVSVYETESSAELSLAPWVIVPSQNGNIAC